MMTTCQIVISVSAVLVIENTRLPERYFMNKRVDGLVEYYAQEMRFLTGVSDAI